MTATSTDMEKRIEALIDSGVDVTAIIDLIDTMDGDADCEAIDEREEEWDGTGNPWGDIRVEFMGPYVRDCLYCGHRHSCDHEAKP